MKYTGIVLAGGKGQELYPLTPKIQKALLPIGNKKLIMYQLELLDKACVSKIVVLLNEGTRRVEEEVQKKYHGKTPLHFYYTPEECQTYEAVGEFLKNNEGSVENNIILVSCDIITSISLKDVLHSYEQKHSDFCYVLKAPEEKPPSKEKQPKEAKQGKQKKQSQQEDLDLFVLNEENGVLFADLLEEIEYTSIKMSNSLIRQSVSCRFEKANDTHIYVFSKRVAKIVMELKNGDLSNFKQDFLPFLVKNQNNIRLLKYTVSEDDIQDQVSVNKPLKISAWFDKDPNGFSKRIIELKDFETVNMKSLVRGPKEIPILLPTANTDAFVADHKFQSTMLSQNTELREGVKIKRSCISPHVKLGKDVQIVNCIILKDTSIADGCKLYNSIVGSRVHIHPKCCLKQCQVGCQAQIRQGSNLNGEILIKSD